MTEVQLVPEQNHSLFSNRIGMVVCMDCKMVARLDAYQDQIHEWKENCCDLEFKPITEGG